MTELRQKVAVVTGASSGVGKEAAKALAQQGFNVIVLGRNPQRCQTAAEEIAAQAPNARDVTALRADFSLLADTRRVAQDILAQTDVIDVLINNAGGVSNAMHITSEGFEQTFTGNYLSPFLLTQLLLPTLIATAKTAPEGTVRVLSTSSVGHHNCPGINFDDLQCIQNYTTGGAYTNAKLGNILFTRELAKRYGEQGIIAHAMEPGVILESNFVNHADDTMQAYMSTLTERAVTSAHAAKTLVWMATDPSMTAANGGYFYELKPADTSVAAQDMAVAERLWQESMAYIQPYLS